MTHTCIPTYVVDLPAYLPTYLPNYLPTYILTSSHLPSQSFCVILQCTNVTNFRTCVTPQLENTVRRAHRITCVRTHIPAPHGKTRMMCHVHTCTGTYLHPCIDTNLHNRAYIQTPTNIHDLPPPFLPPFLPPYLPTDLPTTYLPMIYLPTHLPIAEPAYPVCRLT